MKLCLSFGAVAFALVATATPRLEVPAAGVALGEIFAGESASGTATIRNVGDSPLGVSRVKACCGATAELSSLNLAPGGSAVLTVTLKPQLPGEISKSVHLSCDDPKSPVAVIPVTGTARARRTDGAVSRFTLPAVVMAGVADGFNPCAFSIVIVLSCFGIPM